MPVHMQTPDVCTTYTRVRTFRDAGPALYPRATAPPNQALGSPERTNPNERDIKERELTRWRYV